MKNQSKKLTVKQVSAQNERLVQQNEKLEEQNHRLFMAFTSNTTLVNENERYRKTLNRLMNFVEQEELLDKFDTFDAAEDLKEREAYAEAYETMKKAEDDKSKPKIIT